MNDELISHDAIVTMMINQSNNPNKFRLHPDVYPEGVEASYLGFMGENISKRVFDGGILYQIGKAKFYYGDAIRHPSVRNAPLIAA